MTDSRLRGEWLNSMRFDALSDAAWRVFTCALMWSNEQGTDGAIPTRYARMLHPEEIDASVFDELVSAGLWESTADGWLLLDWAGSLGQSSAEQVATYRKNSADRSRRFREKKALRDDSVAGGVTRDVTQSVGIGTGIGIGNKEKGESENSEPSEFCPSHRPFGSGGVQCGPCGFARRGHDAWKAAQPAAPIPSTPTPPRDDPTTYCPKHDGYAIDHTPCYACEREGQTVAV